MKFTCIDDFFSYDTPGSFYWAGFLAADGCMRDYKNDGKQIALELSNKDISHLEKFKKCIGFNGNIMCRKTRNSSILKVSSSKMFDDLARFNVVPKKSLIYTFPIWIINHPLANHFMRGYFDGDGCFCLQNRTTQTKELKLSVAGTKLFLEVFEDILCKNCGIKKTKLEVNGNIHVLHKGGTKQAIKIRDFLYGNSIPDNRLDRKYDLSHLSDFINRPDCLISKAIIGTSIFTGEEIYFLSAVDANNKGFNRHVVSKCCRGERNDYKNFIWRYE